MNNSHMVTNYKEKLLSTMSREGMVIPNGFLTRHKEMNFCILVTEVQNYFIQVESWVWQGIVDT